MTAEKDGRRTVLSCCDNDMQILKLCSNLWIDVWRNIHERQHVLIRPHRILGGSCQQVCQVSRGIFDFASPPSFQEVLESLQNGADLPDYGPQQNSSNVKKQHGK